MKSATSVMISLVATALLLSAGAVYGADETDANAIRLNNAGVKLLNQKDFEGAITVLGEAIRIAPRYKLARTNMAIACNNLALQYAQEPKKALEWIERSMYVDPDNAITIKNLESLIHSLGMDPKNFADRVKLGDRAFADKRAPGAIIEYKAALAIKNDPEVARKLAAAQRSDFGAAATSSKAPAKPGAETSTKTPAKRSNKH